MVGGGVGGAVLVVGRGVGGAVLVVGTGVAAAHGIMLLRVQKQHHSSNMNTGGVSGLCGEASGSS